MPSGVLSTVKTMEKSRLHLLFFVKERRYSFFITEFTFLWAKSSHGVTGYEIIMNTAFLLLGVL